MGARATDSRLAAGLLALLVVVALAGCGDEENGGSGGGGRVTPTTDLPGNFPDINDQKERAGGFTGLDASNYKNMKSNCGLEDWLTGPDKLQAARDYANLAPPPRRKAILEGCLAGLKKLQGE